MIKHKTLHMSNSYHNKIIKPYSINKGALSKRTCTLSPTPFLLLQVYLKSSNPKSIKSQLWIIPMNPSSCLLGLTTQLPTKLLILRNYLIKITKNNPRQLIIIGKHFELFLTIISLSGNKIVLTFNKGLNVSNVKRRLKYSHRSSKVTKCHHHVLFLDP